MKQRTRKASRPFLTDLDSDKTGHERSYTVDYHHPRAVATLSAEHNLKSKRALSEIRFNYNGQTYITTYDKFFTAKGLARKAFKLLNELV